MDGLQVRDDIDDPLTKGLNVHLYAAIKKALFKPAAFYKVILSIRECAHKKYMVAGLPVTAG